MAQKTVPSGTRQFQKCRWYDPYPRLSFALKLLELAPQPVKAQAWQLMLRETEAAMSKLVQEPGSPYQSERTLERLMSGWMKEQSVAEQRWLRGESGPRDYDQSEMGTRALMMLKNSPDAVKTRVTEKLLALLVQA